MAGLLRANVRLALRTVRASKWRSLLTLTGIVISVAAFIIVVAIGEGIKTQVSSQMSQLGKNLITIRAGQISSGLGFGDTGSLLESGSLAPSDLALARSTRGVEAASPLSLVSSTPRYRGNNYQAGPVIATDQNLTSVIGQHLSAGAFLDDTGSVDSAVLGVNAAKAIFGNDLPLGSSFSLLGQQFVVTGILAQFDNAPFSLNTNFNNAVFVRYDIVDQLTNGHAPIYEILVRPTNPSDETQVVRNLNRRLLRAHGQHNFTVLTQEQSLGVTNGILSLLTSATIGVAAVALLVGGVGIMDVMLVSVAERTKEIGLRKAIGASSRQILKQFVVEALTLSTLGAVIGTIIALVVSYLVYLFTSLTPSITWQSIVIANGVAVLVGVFFGTIPALKAARKNPIDALRNE